eukprot:Partr_v1_DN28273_c2_g1_i3_m76434 putative ubiquitin protein ligase E3 component (N-recognin)
MTELVFHQTLAMTEKASNGQIERMSAYLLLATITGSGQDEMLNPLATDPFDLLIAASCNCHTRDVVSNSGALEFFVLLEIVRVVMELFKPAGLIVRENINPTITTTPPPLISFCGELIRSYYVACTHSEKSRMFLQSLYQRKLLTLTYLSEGNLASLMRNQIQLFKRRVKLANQCCVGLLSSCWTEEAIDMAYVNITTNKLKSKETLEIACRLTKQYALHTRRIVDIEIRRWTSACEKFTQFPRSLLDINANIRLVPLQLKRPGSYKLIDLPNNYQDLLERGLATMCRRCNTVPVNPAICLICGEFVCASTYCCMRDGKGECSLHMARCGLEVGMYLIIKECTVLLFHRHKGCGINVGLKRGKPQFLNQARYNQLQKNVAFARNSHCSETG